MGWWNLSGRNLAQEEESRLLMFSFSGPIQDLPHLSELLRQGTSYDFKSNCLQEPLIPFLSFTVTKLPNNVITTDREYPLNTFE